MLIHAIISVKDGVLAIIQLLLPVTEHLLLKFKIIQMEILVIVSLFFSLPFVLGNLCLDFFHVLLSLLCLIVKLEQVALKRDLVTHLLV